MLLCTVGQRSTSLLQDLRTGETSATRIVIVIVILKDEQRLLLWLPNIHAHAHHLAQLSSARQFTTCFFSNSTRCKGTGKGHQSARAHDVIIIIVHPSSQDPLGKRLMRCADRQAFVLGDPFHLYSESTFSFSLFSPSRPANVPRLVPDHLSQENFLQEAVGCGVETRTHACVERWQCDAKIITKAADFIPPPLPQSAICCCCCCWVLLWCPADPHRPGHAKRITHTHTCVCI